MVQTIYSATNSPKLSFPFPQKPVQFIRNPMYYSPNPSQTLQTLKTQRNSSVSNNQASENSRFFAQIADSKEDFQKREEKYVKTIDFLKSKMEEILKENRNLNEMVRKFQNGGAELHRSTEELEGQINFLIRENEKLSYLCQNPQFYKELDAFNEEKSLCQAKIDELHEKLTLIFEDNDKLSNVLREREEDFDKLQRIYEREARLRVEIEKKYESLLEGKDLGDRTKEFQEENRKLREFLNEQQRVSKDLEGKVEILIQENDKLNAIFQQQSQQIQYYNDRISEFSSANKSLNEDNLKLTEILTLKLKELEELQGRNQGLEDSLENNMGKNGQKEEIITDLEKKVEILLVENGKLHGIIEEKLRDYEGNSNWQEKFRVVADEKNKLQIMLNKKNEAELYWKKKFEEIEGKIKVLFFQTNNVGS